MFLVAGLGNPGKKYELTRHNIGFLFADYLVDKFSGTNFQKAHSGLVSKINIGPNLEKLIILKPETFMNLSGKAVQSAATFYKIKPENIIVAHDDIDLDFQKLKVKFDGGHGGHNGLRDISRLLGPKYLRLRFGVGRPEHKGREADYVLQNFSNPELNSLESWLESGTKALEILITEGLEKAQREINS